MRVCKFGPLSLRESARSRPVGGMEWKVEGLTFLWDGPRSGVIHVALGDDEPTPCGLANRYSEALAYCLGFTNASISLARRFWEDAEDFRQRLCPSGFPMKD